MKKELKKVTTMDDKVMSQLDVELAHAGEETTLSPKMLLLEKMRITPEKQLEPHVRRKPFKGGLV